MLIQFPKANFSPDTLPSNQRGDDMKITERGRDRETGMKKYLIDFPVWDPISYYNQKLLNWESVGRFA